MQISLERDNRRDARPVYRQIADQIRGAIEARSMALGDKLPPIRELARELGVNRDTVALAYEALARSGMVESTVGRGTFVSARMAPTSGFEPQVSPLTERLLAFDRARPRYGSANGAVPMHSVIPDSRLYPIDGFRRALNRALQQAGPELLVYGEPQGLRALREAIAEHYRDHDLELRPEELVLCHGASQGIALALRLFAAPGDVIALEEPTYTNVLASIAGLGLETAAVPMRDGGADLEVLERTLARPEVKAFYTIPTFHNPMGTTTSLSHRQALLDVAARCGKPVIEDAYEADLRIDGRAVPSLASLDNAGRVVHLWSFSKSLFPGVRVGAIAARGRLLDGLLALKQASDLSDSMPLQAALADFVTSGSYAKHLTRLRRVLRGRRDALLAALRDELPADARWTEPEGGYQVWVELAEGTDTSDLLPDAVSEGVLFAPGAQFQHDRRPSRHLRLSYATPDERELCEGVAALGRVLDRRAAPGVRPPRRVSV